MKLLSILLTAILCATASAQTIKTLGYNSTNGQVVANTGTNVLTFTNANMVFQRSLTFQDDVSGIAFEASVGSNSTRFDDSGISFGGLAAATTRTNLSLGATWLTNTNVTNFRTAIGLGATNDVTFRAIQAEEILFSGNSIIYYDGDDYLQFVENIIAWRPLVFSNNTAATTRTNLGLPLAALTNTSNVTMMRALSGSTNTNHPYSGSISVTGTNNTNTLVFSNGILQSVQ